MIFQQRNDPAWYEIIEKCLKNEEKQHDCFILEDEILYKFDNFSWHYFLVIPNSLIEDVLKFYHNSHLVIHLAQKRLLNIIRARFYWNGLHQDVLVWVAACKDCFIHKTNQSLSQGLLIPLVSTKSFAMLCMDIKGPIQNSKNGYK